MRPIHFCSMAVNLWAFFSLSTARRIRASWLMRVEPMAYRRIRLMMSAAISSLVSSDMAVFSCWVVKPSRSSVRRRSFRLARVSSFGRVQTMFSAAISLIWVFT